MPLTNYGELTFAKYLFNNVNMPNIGNAGGLLGSTVAGSFYVSLHTADPGEAGTQATSEVVYTGYARVAVARSTAGWTVNGFANGLSGGYNVTNAAAINFGANTVGTPTITYFGIGTAASGAGILLLSGILDNAQVLAVSSVPAFGIGALKTTVY